MNFKHILVTGGAGYVGAVLVPKLLDKGYDVSVVDLFLYGDVLKKHPKLIQIKADIRDKKVMAKALTNVDAVIHLACISNDSSFILNPRLGKDINYDATLQLVHLMNEAQIKRFIFASSSSVYGVKSEAEVTEDLDRHPLTDYSKYKSLCEDYILQHMNKNCTTVIIRPATVCGYSPRLRLDLTVNILAMQALVNQKITVFGGEQLRPNIHIEDITDLYVKLLKYPSQKIADKIYNAGYENFSLNEIAKMVEHVLNDRKVRIVTLPNKDHRSYKISSQKIKLELGFSPTHTIEEAISDLATAYKQGLIPEALTHLRYFNDKTMQQANLK